MSKTDKHPLISVVTSTFNVVSTIERCIQSIVSQTFGDIEHIIIDGASTDGTPEILRQYNHALAFWSSEPDSGIYDAWNKAVSHISGSWVLFLGADDYLHDAEALSRVAPFLNSAYPDYTIVYGKLVRVDRESSVNLSKMGRPWDVLRKEFDFPTRKFTPHPSTFHHISLFNSENSFDKSYKYSADSKFLGRVLLQKDPLFVDTLISCHTTGGVTGIVETVLGRWFEKYRITRELHLDVPFYKKAKSFVKALTKWMIVKLISGRRYRAVSSFIQKTGRPKTL